MKTCQQVHEQATELLDGQLPFMARLEMRMHLLLCTHCQRFVHHLRALSDALASRARAETPSDGFIARVMTSYDREMRLQPSSQPAAPPHSE